MQTLHDLEARFMSRNTKTVDQHRANCADSASLERENGQIAVSIANAQGCYLEDIDGNKYVDFLGEYSAGPYGHGNKIIRDAIATALTEGPRLGGKEEYPAIVAKLLTERFPAIDLVRFCGTGAEAILLSLSLARAHTGRQKTIAFDGAFHGEFMVMEAGHDTMNVPFPVIKGRYNDAEHARDLIHDAGADLAAVIVEPLAWAGGCVHATQSFLDVLRKETEAVGALLIFDEVISSRLAPAGLQGKSGINPDLTALGKYLGGGLSFGVVGGKAEMMETIARADSEATKRLPTGLFAKNTLTLAAAHAALSSVYTPRAAATLNANGDDIRRRLNILFRQHQIPGEVVGVGALMAVHFTRNEIHAPDDIRDVPCDLRRLFHLSLLEQGQYIGPQGMISLSLPMGHREFDDLIIAVNKFMQQQGDLIRALV